MAQWPGDLLFTQVAGRNLVEQRHEQVVIVAIDQQDIEAVAGETLGSVQPTKPCTDAQSPPRDASSIEDDKRRVAPTRTAD